MSVRAAAALAALALTGAVALSSCGTSTDPTGTAGRAGPPPAPLPAGNRIHGDQLTIYLAAPLTGAAKVGGQAVAVGAARALDAVHDRIGSYRITLRLLDDATTGGSQWSPAAAAQAAQTAATNPTTIAYLGDFNSGATAVSLPVLNRLGIAQVSPYSTAVGLTSDGPGSAPGEPEAYRPTTRATFARVVPSDYVQAQAQVRLQRRRGCRATYVLSDGEYDGDSAAATFEQVARRGRMRIVATQSYVQSAKSYVSVGRTVAQSGADCVLFSSLTGASAVRLVRQVAAANPRLRLFATAGLAERSFTDPAAGGIPATVGRRLLITAPDLPAADGREAMALVLAAISRATYDGRRAAQRVNVAGALFALGSRDGPLGRYRITADGDTSLRSYGVYRVVGGGLRQLETIRGG